MVAVVVVVVVVAVVRHTGTCTKNAFEQVRCWLWCLGHAPGLARRSFPVSLIPDVVVVVVVMVVVVVVVYLLHSSLQHHR